MKTLLSDVSILIKNGSSYETMDHSYLVIDDEIISYVGKNKPSGDFDKVYELSNHLVMPGLINSHGHSPMTLLRCAGSGYKLHDWLNKAIFPVEAKMIPLDIYAGTEMAMLEMLASGTTSFSTMYDFPYASAKAVAEMKGKASICRTGWCFDFNLDMKDCPRLGECIDILKIFYGYKDGNDELFNELKVNKLPNDILLSVKRGDIIPTLSIHSVYLASTKFIIGLMEENKELKGRIEIHLSETKKELEDALSSFGKTPTVYLNDLGVFKYDTFCAHCVTVDDNDLKILKENNSSIVFNPASNMKLCSGMAPIKKALDMGVNVALGTDGCASNDNLDMFKEMYVAGLLSNLEANAPASVKASEIIDMATINGAKALGRKDTGEIKVGKKADLIVIDLDKPHLKPFNDPAAVIVYSMSSSDVVMTFVNGYLLYDHGEYPYYDINKINKDFKEALKRLDIKE